MISDAEKRWMNILVSNNAETCDICMRHATNNYTKRLGTKVARQRKHLASKHGYWIREE